jgi:hypothetical protein
MSFQDSTTDHLQASIRQKRRRACDLVAEAWNFLEDGKTASSKIIPLLVEAVELIRPSDVRGQMLLIVPAPASTPAPKARQRAETTASGRHRSPVHCWSRDGKKQEFVSIHEAQVTGDTYNSIVQSIYREGWTKNGLRWHYTKKPKTVNLEEAINARVKPNT